MVRGLEHVELAQDQSQLAVLLDKIGAKTLENVRKTPDLISQEAVILKLGHTETRRNFSFLILQHRLDPQSAVFDEYRVDLKNGEQIETDFEKIASLDSPAPSPPAASQLTVLPAPPSESPTLSQGFVNQWLYFYPTNQSSSEFRYLGEEAVNGHQALVVAFAQKPASVRLPATFVSENTTYQIFVQGIAWIDPSDYRIMRLQTDLLSSAAGRRLRQLTVDTRFAEVRLAGVPSPLWMPRQARVTASIGTITLDERHTYTDYRLFRAHSKIVMK
ncbi:MAG TPA: hypothetical protein VIW68_14470 [Candidatus Sulfotelmatobacter sp.]